MTTADAFLSFKPYTATLPKFQGLRGANLGTRGVLTGPTDDHHEPPLHAPHRPHADAGLGQARSFPPGTGEHATLAADAPFGVDYGQALADLNPP